MKNFVYAVCAVFGLGLLASPGDAGEVVKQIKVQKNWPEYVIYGDGGGRYTARWKATVMNNAVVLCGAGAFQSQTLSYEITRAMRNVHLRIDGKSYLKGIKFFSTAASPDRLVGAPANCVSTGKRPPAQVKKGVGLQLAEPNWRY